MDSPDNMRFVADAMLGRLARWLRALGYDTLYSASFADGYLARIATAEQRILLTRDRELTRRKGLKAILIESDHIEEQLRQLFQALPLGITYSPFGRCLKCNAELRLEDRHNLYASVPPYVWQTQEQFRRCPVCGRIYWRGTHWQRMLERIATLPSYRTDG